MERLKIGVLALQGGVSEHVRATEAAAKKLGMRCTIAEIRTNGQLGGLDGLIIPGGESTTLLKLCRRAGMLGAMRRVPAMFGTCAGAILLAKKLRGAENGQRPLGLMDLEMGRNAYGRQSESFEETLTTEVGALNAIFIRAPRVLGAGSRVRVLAALDGEPVACEQASGRRYYLAACFHPELATTLFHERFLERLR
jgi:5'-phosphate synthase pdxT subunit